MVTSNPVVGVYDADPGSYLPLIERAIPADRLRLCREPNRLAELAADVDVLLAFKFAGEPFRRDAVLGLERLAWVQLGSAGGDHMLPFDSSRLTVTSASGIHGETMATYVMATVVHMIWDFPRLLRQQQDHQWIKYQVPSLAGLTIGILGAGHVGQRIGERARTFGMRVIGTRRGGGVIEGFDVVRGPEGLRDVLNESDITVVTLPLTEETRGILGRRELRSIKAGGWLVNVSRGGIVHEDSLLEVLREGHLAGAVVDVFASEPLPPDSPFWDMSNVLVTPHMSSEFAGWPGAVARLFLKNLDLWMRRMPLLNVVDPSRGY